MPNSKKKKWAKPTLTRFSSLAEVRAYYLARAGREQIEAVERMVEQFRKVDMREAEHGESLRRRRA